MERKRIIQTTITSRTFLSDLNANTSHRNIFGHQVTLDGIISINRDIWRFSIKKIVAIIAAKISAASESQGNKSEQPKLHNTPHF